MEIFSIVVNWFKQLFGIKPVSKTEQEINSDFDEVEKISVTATIAERLTTLTIVDSSMEVVGENKRAQYLNNIIKWICNNKIAAIGQMCLGTGDCIVKPNTNGKRIGIDIIQNRDFVIVEIIGDFLISVLVRCEKVIKNNRIYERWEFHKLNEYEDKSYVTIQQYAFLDNKQVALSCIPAWEGLKETTIIPNVDRLLLGRFKCPKINRNDINSPNGVPITSGAEEIVEQVKKSYRRFNEEFEAMEPMIFADKRVFKPNIVKTPNGKSKEVSTIPKGKDRVIQSVSGGGIDGQPMMKEWAPSIRDVSLDAAIERNFRMLELFCGLSEGILSKSSLTYTNVDEVRKSTQATFAFITNFRNILEQGMTDLLYAIDVIANYNMITPMGEYTINFDWSDSFIESMQERFNQLLQGLNLDTISKAEFRAWLKNEPLEIAEVKIAEMEAKGNDIDDVPSNE